MDGMPQKSTYAVEVTEKVHPESRNAIIRGLLEFNVSRLGDLEPTSLDIYVRDGDGKVVGGLVGDVGLGWLSIHALWVAEELRGSGLGTDILKAAENAAIKYGCHAVILDTLSFQAPGFYEKRGYSRIVFVDGYLGGSQKIFMQKHLDGLSTRFVHSAHSENPFFRRMHVSAFNFCMGLFR